MITLPVSNTTIWLYPQHHIQEHMTHAFLGILHRTHQGEQMSLSTGIKNHYSDTFTNSYVTPNVEDKWWTPPCGFWAVNFVHMQAHFLDTMKSLFFLKLTTSSPSNTLHTAESMSLKLITNSGREKGGKKKVRKHEIWGV